MRAALDTNILVYAEGVNGADRKAQAVELIRRSTGDDIIIPVQALGELFTVLTRKARRTATEARNAVLLWFHAFETAETSAAILLDAMELSTTHQLSLWDAIIVSAAAQARCQTLWSEDIQNGFTWRGVTIRSPF